ncbi:hypothetical protein QMK19_23265 [Streptomyces sp. H10-C2]|uniref:hypothetical protein n=1 Tax=unclassified Streptomyces TaxID=2593676 RepID=UPI0024BB8B0A|nr:MULTISPECIES: hypothetical protein [unclassified Streptomyces]MDJ0342827.1 hypothetical protein [Streptomyces sp. PH10-H1]MDJ0372505.1 hypothetical protein [Streptomyces sp. H10-C2]
METFTDPAAHHAAGKEPHHRLTASTVTDPALEDLYAERDRYLRLLAVVLIMGASA